MDIANLLVRVLFTLYTIHIVRMLLFKEKRQKITVVNQRLEELRAKPMKTLEEQKEFIDMRYPKFWGKFKGKKFTWKKTSMFLLNVAILLLVLQAYKFLFKLLGIDLPLYVAIIIILFFPALVNYILKKFGIQKQDISVFFRK